MRYWLHNGFVNVDSEKMSKSLGNFFTIREVRARVCAGDCVCVCACICACGWYVNLYVGAVTPAWGEEVARLSTRKPLHIDNSKYKKCFECSL